MKRLYLFDSLIHVVDMFDWNVENLKKHILRVSSRPHHKIERAVRCGTI